ncbi:hypothetical protein IE077_001144, partial [Cardiosporidium cionae]
TLNEDAERLSYWSMPIEINSTNYSDIFINLYSVLKPKQKHISDAASVTSSLWQGGPPSSPSPLYSEKLPLLTFPEAHFLPEECHVEPVHVRIVMWQDVEFFVFSSPSTEAQSEATFPLCTSLYASFCLPPPLVCITNQLMIPIYVIQSTFPHLPVAFPPHSCLPFIVDKLPAGVSSPSKKKQSLCLCLRKTFMIKMIKEGLDGDRKEEAGFSLLSGRGETSPTESPFSQLLPIASASPEPILEFSLDAPHSHTFAFCLTLLYPTADPLSRPPSPPLSWQEAPSTPSVEGYPPSFRKERFWFHCTLCVDPAHPTTRVTLSGKSLVRPFLNTFSHPPLSKPQPFSASSLSLFQGDSPPLSLPLPLFPLPFPFSKPQLTNVGGALPQSFHPSPYFSEVTPSPPFFSTEFQSQLRDILISAAISLCLRDVRIIMQHSSKIASTDNSLSCLDEGGITPSGNDATMLTLSLSKIDVRSRVLAGPRVSKGIHTTTTLPGIDLGGPSSSQAEGRRRTQTTVGTLDLFVDSEAYANPPTSSFEAISVTPATSISRSEKRKIAKETTSPPFGSPLSSAAPLRFPVASEGTASSEGPPASKAAITAAAQHIVKAESGDHEGQPVLDCVIETYLHDRGPVLYWPSNEWLWPLRGVHDAPFSPSEAGDAFTPTPPPFLASPSPSESLHLPLPLASRFEREGRHSPPPTFTERRDSPTAIVSSSSTMWKKGMRTLASYRHTVYIAAIRIALAPLRVRLEYTIYSSIVAPLFAAFMEVALKSSKPQKSPRVGEEGRGGLSSTPLLAQERHTRPRPRDNGFVEDQSMTTFTGGSGIRKEGYAATVLRESLQDDARHPILPPVSKDSPLIPTDLEDALSEGNLQTYLSLPPVSILFSGTHYCIDSFMIKEISVTLSVYRFWKVVTFDEAEFTWTALLLKQQLLCIEAFRDSIIDHFYRQLKKQWYQVLLSFDLVGRPISRMRKIWNAIFRGILLLAPAELKSPVTPDCETPYPWTPTPFVKLLTLLYYAKKKSRSHRMQKRVRSESPIEMPHVRSLSPLKSIAAVVERESRMTFLSNEGLGGTPRRAATIGSPLHVFRPRQTRDGASPSTAPHSDMRRKFLL